MSDRNADDIGALFPATFEEQRATVAGVDVVVRELTTEQSLRIGARMQPVIAALLPHYGAEADGVASDTVLAALEAHPDVALELLSLSTGQSVEWLAGLPESAGMHLMLLCVLVHVPFFARRLDVLHQSRAQLDGLARVRASASSSPGSSATGTTPPH